MKVNYDYTTVNTYLTEENLGIFLKSFLPECEIIHNKQVPNSGLKNRPDYRIEDLKMIIEYDGDKHYKEMNVITKDELKDKIYTDMGYKVVRLPYWISLHDEIISAIFKDKIDLNTKQLKNFNNFPIGFITEGCILPCDFSTYGLMKYKQSYDYWLQQMMSMIHKSVDFSLMHQANRKNSLIQVYPINKEYKQLLEYLIEYRGEGVLNITENIMNEYLKFYKNL